jgi:hypothetical protein
MQGRSIERASMLVLRVWREEDHELRARITQTPDVLAHSQTTLAASGVEQICAVVRSWLEQLQRGDASVTER